MEQAENDIAYAAAGLIAVLHDSTAFTGSTTIKVLDVEKRKRLFGKPVKLGSYKIVVTKLEN